MSFLLALQHLSLPRLFACTLVSVATIGVLVLFAVRLAAYIVGVPRGEAIPIRDALIGSLSALFALTVAFSAAGIWNDAVQARAAVQREANAIENVDALSSQFSPQLRESVHVAMLAYARRVIEKDWPAMQRWTGVNETLYDRGNGPLIPLINSIASAGKEPRAASDLVITQLMDLRGARLQREMIARGGVSTPQWIALIVIAISAMIVIAIAHNHLFGLQAAALTVYVVGVAAAFFLVLAHDKPFVGRSGVKPLPIQQAIDRIERSYMDR